MPGSSYQLALPSKYEELKQGLYDARNLALNMIGSMAARKEPISAKHEKAWAQNVRPVLNDVKKHIETISNNLK